MRSAHHQTHEKQQQKSCDCCLDLRQSVFGLHVVGQLDQGLERADACAALG